MNSRRAALRSALAALLLAPLAGLSACGGGSAGNDAPLRVLILYAADPAYAADVAAKLDATGLFGSVGSLDVSTGPLTAGNITPNADVVLVMKDSGFYDPSDFGDVLADVVDQGVGVVLTVFCYEPGRITGRFASDDYFTMTDGDDSGGGPLGFTADVPGHPLFTGVAVFGGGTTSFRTTGTPYPSSTKIASWLTAGSPPLLVERTLPNGRLRVDVGFYPPTSDVSPGFVAPSDSVRMVANALLRVGGRL